MLSAKETARLQGAEQEQEPQAAALGISLFWENPAALYQSAKRLWIMLPRGFLEFS